jgi:lipid II:glycine glycyltransferase (peptidoglycan interpeptide bridge formation enzyme)
VIEVKEIGDKSTWESFNLASANPTFLQSWVWGQFQKNLNRNIYRLGVFKDKNLIGISLLIEERAKVGAFLYCRMEKGVPFSLGGSQQRNSFREKLRFFEN